MKAMKRKTWKNWLAIPMLVLMIFVVSFQSNAANSEPNWYCGAYDSSVNPFSMSGYYGQCTWYCWGRAYELTGINVPCRNNAATWADVARSAGYTVSSTPRENSIAVWNGGSAGHVAFVENVSGNNVTISEANWGKIIYDQSWSLQTGINYYAGRKTLTTGEMNSRWGSLLGYIYVGNDPNLGSTGTWTSSVSNITDTNATVSARITLPSTVQFQWVGCNFFDTSGNRIAQAGQTTTAKGSYIDISYNVTNNTPDHYKLNPGTTYKYQFYATYGGVDHFSPMYSFKTTSQDVPVWTSSVSNITDTNATVSARITLSSSVQFQWVGCNFFDVNGNMVAQAGQTTTAKGNYIDISYDITKNTSAKYVLKPWTTYKYQFYATYGGVDHFSPMYSFKTTHQHSYTSKITKAPTCTANGVCTYTCTICGDTYTASVNKTGHNYVKSVVAPTYTAQGYTQYKCSVCGDSYKTDYTAQLTKPDPEPTPDPKPTPDPAPTPEPTPEPDKGSGQENTTKPGTGTNTSANTPGNSTGSNTGAGNNAGGGQETSNNPAPDHNTVLMPGATYTTKNVTYQITSIGLKSGEVSVQKIADKSITSASISASVEINGTTFKITEIASGAFQNCTNLTKVSINKNVKTIGSKAFYNCKKLQTVSGCGGVTKIGNKAFSGCVKLTTVGSKKNVITLPKVKTIGNNAFSNCKAIKKVNVTSASLTKIDTSAFAGCTSMTGFTAKSKNLASIGNKAFMGDKKLSSITLSTPKLTRAKVGASAFKGIKSNCKVKVPASKVASYKTILKAKGAGSKVTVTK